jgi:ElaB/YqjD/DUF883 family membrane-anchored ribosome-binding protein
VGHTDDFSVNNGYKRYGRIDNRSILDHAWGESAPSVAVLIGWWFTMVEYKASKEKAAKAMEKSAESFEETGTKAAHKAAGAMRKMASDIRGFSLDKYKEQVMDSVDDVSDEVDKNVDNVKAGIREHPFESVAIAAGAGILFGAVIALTGRHAAKRMHRT